MAVRQLSPRLKELARQNVNEDENKREDSIYHIKNWLSEQPHLNARTDSQWLIAFLRSCKFSLKHTKSRLSLYYKLKTSLPEFFENRDPSLPEIQELLTLGSLIPLPLPNEKGRRIILRRFVNDPERCKEEDVFKTNMMVMDALVNEDDHSSICGIEFIMDHSKSPMQDISRIEPNHVAKITNVMQNGYPIRRKAIHHLHMNETVQTLFGFFRSLLDDDMKKRIYLHEDLHSLHEQIPRQILPYEYGGCAGPINNMIDEWKQKVEAQRLWFLEDENYKYNEMIQSNK